jgi:hypothetical protein
MRLENVYIADCETTGFLPNVDKIHTFGISWKNSSGEWLVKDTPNYEDMIKVLSNPENILVMHNGILYDKPVLEHVLKIKIQATIIDTLPIVWYLFPNRIKEGKKYGLGSFGTDYGVAKPEIESWEGLSYEEYSHRVREDVIINRLLWEDCLAYYLELYDDNVSLVGVHIRFLMSIMDLVAEQEFYGIKLDKKLCEEGLEVLTKLADEKINILKTVMPKIPVKKVVNFPKKGLYKQDGSLSAMGEKYLICVKGCGLPLDYQGPIEVITSYKDSNPVSVSQVKDFLLSIGWVPERYEENINTKGESIKVAQIKTKDKLLCPSVIKLVDKVPELKALEDLSTINHRASYLTGFLKNVRDDGYIQAQISGLTNTIRLKHKTLVNLPKVSASFGQYVRPVLTCEDDEVMIGSDLSSLENYTRTNFVLPWQPDAAAILDDPDYDSHTQLAIYAGMMDQSDEDLYKWYKKGTKDRSLLPEKYSSNSDEEISNIVANLNKIRNKAKTTSYSALYGIGKVKLAKELKISDKEAQQLLDGYWALNIAVKKFTESLYTKTIRNQLWVLNPGNNFYYSARGTKDLFSTVNQGFGSFIHVLWCKNMRQLDIKIRANFHDEAVIVCKSGDEGIVSNLLQQAIERTNKQAKLNVPVKIDIQVGKNYGEIH